MSAEVSDIYQENLYAESYLLDMPECYEVLQHFLDIDGDCVPNWVNMPENERKERIREIILDEFPQKMKDIEKCIRYAWEVANATDEIHRTCTLARLVASSTGASSGILSFLGIPLAPFTAGGSLILTNGLCFVAAATSICANLYESASTSKEIKTAHLQMDQYRIKIRMANCSIKTNDDWNPMHVYSEVGPTEFNGTYEVGPTEFNGAYEVGPTEFNGAYYQESVLMNAGFDSEFPTNNNNQNFDPKIACAGSGIAFSVYKTARKINQNVLKRAPANIRLKGLAGKVTKAGKAISRKQAEKAFTGTSFAVSKGARLSSAMTGAFVLFDAYNIAQDAKHLQEGAKAETAAELREKARKLKEELQVLIKLYEEVQRDHYL